MKHLLKIAIGTVILIFIMTGPAAGQLNNHLILKKGGKNIKHFLVGDEIRLLKNNFKTPVVERIQAIGEDFIVIRNEELLIKDISGIIHIRALHFRAAGAMTKIAGPGLILIDGFNSLIRGFSPLFSTNILIAGAAIFASGFILPLLQTKVYYMNKKYYLRIVPSDPETYRNLKKIKYSPS